VDALLCRRREFLSDLARASGCQRRRLHHVFGHCRADLAHAPFELKIFETRDILILADSIRKSPAI
jgi:hypothetical protein